MATKHYLVRAAFEPTAVGKIARLIAQLFIIMLLNGTVFGNPKIKFETLLSLLIKQCISAALA